MAKKYKPSPFDDEPAAAATDTTAPPSAGDFSSLATKLSPADEGKYQQWKATLPQRLQYEGDYDLRGFYKKNPAFSVDQPEQHMTDEFKLPNHKTFSNESRYYNAQTKHMGGHWEKDVFVPNDTKYKQRVDETQYKPSPFDAEPASGGPNITAANLKGKFAVDEGVPFTEGEREYRGPEVAKSTSAARGGLQGATYGFGDELAAAVDTGVSKVPGLRDFAQMLHGDNLPINDPSIGYSARRDAYRAKNEEAQQANPKTFLAGELVGSVAAPVPGGSAVKGATTAAKVASVAKTGAKLGALAGLGTSKADLASGDTGEIGKAVKDVAVSAATGAVLAPAVHGVGELVAPVARAVGRAVVPVSKALKPLANKFESKASQDRIEAVSQGSGHKGSATMTTKKKLAQDSQGLDQVLTDRFTHEGKPTTLGSIMRQDAEKVIPAADEYLSHVGSKLDPLYEKFNAAEGGGMSLNNFINFADDTIATLSKKPLQEKWINAIKDVKESALNAWAPGLAQKLKGNDNLRLLGLDSPVVSRLADVKVPYQDFRAMVTQLQKRGTKTLDTLHPGEATQVKADTGTALRNFLNADLERVAENTPALSKDAEKLFAINRKYKNAANVRDALEERMWKEKAGNTSGKGHVAHMVGAAVGGIAGHAIPIPVVGHAIGAAVGASAGPAAAKFLSNSRVGMTSKAAKALETLVTAKGQKAIGNLVMDAVRAGVPAATAIEGARLAQGNGR